MAREGGAVTRVVCGIVHRVNMGKAREVNEKRPKHGCADSRYDTLAVSGGGGCGLCTAGAD